MARTVIGAFLLSRRIQARSEHRAQLSYGGQGFGCQQQPRGLKEGSRGWSESSSDTPGTEARDPAPRQGCQSRCLRPLPGSIVINVRTGGLHCAATSGYPLATLRVATPAFLLIRELPNRPLKRPHHRRERSVIQAVRRVGEFMVIIASQEAGVRDTNRP